MPLPNSGGRSERAFKERDRDLARGDDNERPRKPKFGRARSEEADDYEDDLRRNEMGDEEAIAHPGEGDPETAHGTLSELDSPTGDKYRTVEYRGYHITHRAAPIPGGIADWQFCHDSYDGAPDGNDNRCGTASSLLSAMDQINDLEDDLASEDITESTMSRVMTEWDPSFNAAGYKPGDYQMPSPTGDGVAEKGVKNDTVGKYDTELSDMGKEWPRDHKDTAAMCDVDEDGVEHKPQGGHESTHGEPTDGHTKKLGHNWPDEAKNSGGHLEPFKGSRWSDGGTLTGGSGQDEFSISNNHKIAGEGEITGTSGPQLGQPQESWSPDSIGSLMESNDIDLQKLFDNYAKQADFVCLEDFQQLCNAYGFTVSLTEASIVKLMDKNADMMFYEGKDASGSYWVGKPVAVSEGNVSKKKGVLSEGLPHDMEPDEPFGNGIGADVSEFADEPGMGRGPGPDLGPDVGGIGGIGAMMDGPDMGIGGGGPDDFGEACPGCGYDGLAGEEACPECGEPVEMGGLGDEPWGMTDVEADADTLASAGYGTDEDYGGYGGGDGFFDSKVRMTPAIKESLDAFLQAAENIISRNSGSTRKLIGEALQYAWMVHGEGVDPRSVSAGYQKQLAGLVQNYPSFKIMVENVTGMDNLGGTAIGGGGKPKVSDQLAEEDNPGPDDIKEMGEPLGKKQTNTYEETPVIKGTGKGMNGSNNYSESVKHNLAKLTSHVKPAIAEAAKGISGKYQMAYSVLVKDGNSKNRTNRTNSLAEALADAEEILQIHGHKDVVLETYFTSGEKVLRKANVGLTKVQSRGPLVSEGRALFRFNRTAEGFAEALVNEGHECQIADHNWGHAVSAKIDYRTAMRAFQALKG